MFQLQFDNNNDKGGEYEVEEIWDSTVYARESKDNLIGLYFPVS